MADDREKAARRLARRANETDDDAEAEALASRAAKLVGRKEQRRIFRRVVAERRQ